MKNEPREFSESSPEAEPAINRREMFGAAGMLAAGGSVLAGLQATASGAEDKRSSTKKSSSQFEATGLTITAPTPDGSVDFSTGAGTARGTTTAGQVIGMNYQIDDQFIHSINSAFDFWSIGISPAECPTVGASYLLTVYAYGTDGTMEIKSVRFTRSA